MTYVSIKMKRLICYLDGCLGFCGLGSWTMFGLQLSYKQHLNFIQLPHRAAGISLSNPGLRDFFPVVKLGQTDLSLIRQSRATQKCSVWAEDWVQARHGSRLASG